MSIGEVSHGGWTRTWINLFYEGSYNFLKDAALLHDFRVYMHFYATGITPAMVRKNMGVGSQHLIGYLDKDGNTLDRSKTHWNHLPSNLDTGATQNFPPHLPATPKGLGGKKQSVVS